MNNNFKDKRVYLLSYFGRGSVDDKEQYIKITTGQAYLDMQPRTVKHLTKKDIEPILVELGKELFDYIHSPVKDMNEFDSWHKSKCDWFKNRIKSRTGINLSYGKAQKIINISLKYIYCLNGAEKVLDKFKHCHMVLDRYTYSEGYYKKEIKSKKGKIIPWSKLEKYDDYKHIQSNIREDIKKRTFNINKQQVQLTPFEAEFIIFDDYIKKLK